MIKANQHNRPIKHLKKKTQQMTKKRQQPITRTKRHQKKNNNEEKVIDLEKDPKTKEYKPKE